MFSVISIISTSYNFYIQISLLNISQVLACAPSNVAVDNLVERLVKGKVKVCLRSVSVLQSKVNQQCIFMDKVTCRLLVRVRHVKQKLGKASALAG